MVHLDIIKWLHKNRAEGCTTYAIGEAAKYGHFEVVRWLNESRSEGFLDVAMTWAEMNKHSEIVEYLKRARLGMILQRGRAKNQRKSNSNQPTKASKNSGPKQSVSGGKANANGSIGLINRKNRQSLNSGASAKGKVEVLSLSGGSANTSTKSISRPRNAPKTTVPTPKPAWRY